LLQALKGGLPRHWVEQAAVAAAAEQVGRQRQAIGMVK